MRAIRLLKRYNIDQYVWTCTGRKGIYVIISHIGLLVAKIKSCIPRAFYMEGNTIIISRTLWKEGYDIIIARQ